jgi:FtsP/CotA-like multicopper oxidase with cupredoxin domain
MSNGARIGLLGATVVVLVLAFALLSPGDDDDSNTASTPTATAPATAPESPAEDPPQTTTAVTPPASAPPAAEFERIRVQGGKPAGGVKTITVKRGDRARIQVSSQDTSDEVHLHGYDISRDLKAGDSVRFSFKADAEGIFEIELHGTHTQIGKLVVEP